MSLGEYLRLGIRDEWIAPAGEEDGYATLPEACQDMQETIRALLPEDAGFEKLLYRTARDTGRPPEETSAWRSLSRESSPAGEASRSEAAAADGEAPQEEHSAQQDRRARKPHSARIQAPMGSISQTAIQM